MSNPWFRMYSEFATDPKVQMLPESMQRRLLMLFCLRCNESIDGASDEEVAFALRIDGDAIAETKKLFVHKGFIDESWNIAKWDSRQFTSDSSAERVRKYREKRASMGLTSNGYTKHSVTVMQRDGHACVYCGCRENLCLDHVKPLFHGGSDAIENLVTACKACNSGKSGRTPDEAGYKWLNKKAESMWKAWCNGYGNALDTDTDTDTEIKVSKDTLSPVPATMPDCPHIEIIELYEKHLPTLPKTNQSLWAGKRADALRMRWKWLLTAKRKNGDRYATDREAGIAWFDKFFGYVSESDFLSGRNGKWTACDLGWLVKADNFTKVVQGNYENKVLE